MWSFFDCDQMQCIIFPVLYKHFNNMLVFKNWVFHSKVLPCIVVACALAQPKWVIQSMRNIWISFEQVFFVTKVSFCSLSLFLLRDLIFSLLMSQSQCCLLVWFNKAPNSHLVIQVCRQKVQKMVGACLFMRCFRRHLIIAIALSGRVRIASQLSAPAHIPVVRAMACDVGGFRGHIVKGQVLQKSQRRWWQWAWAKIGVNENPVTLRICVDVDFRS